MNSGSRGLRPGFWIHLPLLYFQYDGWGGVKKTVGRNWIWFSVSGLRRNEFVRGLTTFRGEYGTHVSQLRRDMGHPASGRIHTSLRTNHQLSSRAESRDL